MQEVTATKNYTGNKTFFGAITMNIEKQINKIKLYWAIKTSGKIYGKYIWAKCREVRSISHVGNTGIDKLAKDGFINIEYCGKVKYLTMNKYKSHNYRSYNNE